MGQTTFTNSRGIAHKGSGGMSIAFPDVCKTPTPAGPIPIPYPNIGKASETSDGPKKVGVDGKMPMTKGAKYSTSSGDEAGSAGGVLSNKFQGSCEFMLYSFDGKASVEVRYALEHLFSLVKRGRAFAWRPMPVMQPFFVAPILFSLSSCIEDWSAETNTVDDGGAAYDEAGPGGEACDADVCVEECAQGCESPPEPECIGSVLRAYEESGTCSQGVCTYDSAEMTCAFGCDDGTCNCAGCDSPPDPECIDSTLRSYKASGTCSAGNCVYNDFVDTLCAYACLDGACSTCAGSSCPQPGDHVSAGGAHTCGVKADGSVVCWGRNDSGQSTPPAGAFASVSAGDHHTCGVKADGSVACWGEDDYGQSTPPTETFKH